MERQRNSRAGNQNIAAYNRTYLAANRERINSRKKKRYYENLEHLRAEARQRSKFSRPQKSAWRSANIEKARYISRSWWKGEAGQRYIRDNRGLMNASKKAHKMARAAAMPPWADRAAIAAFYVEAAARTKSTGVLHHVDHILPLQGEGFNGLHVPWNLQVLTGSDNMSKGNRVQGIM